MSSFLVSHKDIHVKLTKDAHSKLRALLFQKELSMQDLFEEFTQLIVNENQNALRIVDNLVVKKAQNAIDKVTKQPVYTELDKETLYSMLENQSPLGKNRKEEE